MPDPETPDDDALEQRQGQDEAEAAIENRPPEVALEASEADAVDQQREVDPRESAGRSEPAFEADEGDLAESEREVPLDEEDYR